MAKFIVQRYVSYVMDAEVEANSRAEVYDMIDSFDIEWGSTTDTGEDAYEIFEVKTNA